MRLVNGGFCDLLEREQWVDGAVLRNAPSGKLAEWVDYPPDMMVCELSCRSPPARRFFYICQADME